MDAFGHGKKQVTSLVRQPRALRVGILAFEVMLVALIAYQAVGLVRQVMEPARAPELAPAAKAGTRQVVSTDMSPLTGADPFFREIANPAAPAQALAAPESSLQLELFGLRATGSGQGSAIVKTQDGKQQLVRVGDTISPGVKLAGVYRDRLEILRAGSLEAIYLRPQGERAARRLAPSGHVAAPGAPGGDSMLDRLSALGLEPVRRDRRIIGFRLPESMPDMVAALGLEAGDILLAANGEPLNSFERIQEIGEELANARRIDLTIERRGETRSLSLGL